MQNVHGVIQVGICSNRHLFKNLPDCEGDVCIHHVVTIGNHQGSVLCPETSVSFRIAQPTRYHLIAHVDQIQCFVYILHDNDIFILILPQPVDKIHGDRIVVCENDMSFRVIGQFPGGPGSCLGLKPWCIKKLNESEGKHDEKQYDTG